MSELFMDAYAKIETIPGEALAKGFEGWIQITDFEHKVSQNPVTTQSSGGSQSSGRVSIGEVRFEKLVDAATPQLLGACAVGRHIAKVEFHFTRANEGGQVTYYTVKLGDALITNVVHSASARKADAIPREQVSLYFRTIDWDYHQTSQTGGGISGAKHAGWDASTNTVR